MPIASLVQDLRYTVRTLRRDAGFAILTIAIAGLGIGASSTVFSVVNTLLRPLPFADPERLVWIANQETSGLSGQTTHQREGECRSVGVNAAQQRHADRVEVRQRARRADRQEQSHHRATQRQDDAFGEHLGDPPTASGPQRRPDRDLFLPRRSGSTP
jgi:hypothetical protein